MNSDRLDPIEASDTMSTPPPGLRTSPRRRIGCAGWWVLGLLAGQDSLAQTAAPPGTQPTLQVGPTRDVRTLAQAAGLAVDGSRIEVDAGVYVRDTAVWPQNGLRFQAMGGRVRLLADGAAAQGKAIFVMRGRNVSITGFDFTGARVPSRNGAGIRLEAGTLRVEDCRFLDNESGILTGNDPSIELEVSDSEFGHQRQADGSNHHLYAGAIARLKVTRSHFHHAASGHLVKSRASVNEILDNRLEDGDGGRASYELEFPNGGQATVIGNRIAQSAGTENPVMVSFGAEGYRPGTQHLNIQRNTLTNPLAGKGPWVRVYPGDVRVTIQDNTWVGAAADAAIALPPGVQQPPRP